MEHYKIFSIVAGIVFVSAFIPYFIAIFRNQTKPQKTSWLVWAALDTLALTGMIKEDVVNGQIVGAVCCAWFVFLLAVKKGKPGWTNLDRACLLFGFAGAVLWIIYGNATSGIVAASVGLIIAAIPTFKSAWYTPEHENKLAWAIFWISCVFTLLSVESWNINSGSQPISFFIIESVVVGILFFKKRKA